MTTYRVSTVFSQRELLEFINRNPGSNMTVEAIPDNPETRLTGVETPVEPIYKPARGPRRQRKSKVNEAILGSLRLGRGSPEELRNAVVDAGMAPSSLSTGLQILQKAGTIRRNGDGVYYMADEIQ